MKKYILLVFLLFAVVLTACQAQATPVEVQPQVSTELTTPTVPAVEAGKTSITGRVLSETTKEPFKNTVVRLAEVYRQGDRAVYALDGASSPGAITDDQGYFVFSNIRKAEYVVVIGSPDISYAIVVDEQGAAIMYPTEEGKVLELGELYVDYVP